MKLQQQVSRQVNQQVYKKYVITLPPKEIKKLGWKPGQNLSIEVKGKEARIKPE